jgi:5-methyltetrahydrofolate--homocysteine methyltransferase
VLNRAVSPELRPALASEVAEQYATLRAQHAERDAGRQLLPIAEARARAPRWDDWGHVVRPRVPGPGVLTDYPLAELVERIDWGPFLQTWEIAGRYPDVLDDPKVGRAARDLMADARAILERAQVEGWLEARAAFGLFPAAARGDDLLLYTDETRTAVRAVVPTLRQQAAKRPGQPNLALADFVAPEGSATDDWAGAFVVSIHGAEERARAFEAEHDDYHAIMVKALADRLAEALAERLHERVRTEFWGYAPDERLGNAELIAERYRGIRPAPGYPACPDHRSKATIFELLDAERALGVALTSSLAIVPTAAVAGFYFAHPEARYFGVGKVGRDQVRDLAARTGAAVDDVERWLAPVLGYPT